MLQMRDNYAEDFAQALLNPDAPPPLALTGPNAESTARRFAIYRNNVFTSLGDALEARFPVCRRLVGDSFFRVMAHEHIRCSPPSSPVLAEYGAEFADFVSGYEPARALPYLSDVARLEYDIGCAYDAADATPELLQHLLGMPPDQLAGSRMQLHPSVRLLSSAHPIVSIWRTNSHDSEVELLDATAREDALIVRPFWNVEVHRLPAGGFHFTRAIAEGETLSEATSYAQSRDSKFDLAASVRLLAATGALAAIVAAPSTISS